MSTYELSERVAARIRRRRAAALRLPAPLAPTALASALLVVVLYAAFAQGATRAPAEPRVQVALDAILALAGASWLWTGRLRACAPRLAWAGFGLLATFAAWCGVTLLWSVAAADTWLELNRYLAYVVVLWLAIVLGASARRSLERVALGFLAVALAVSAYALGQKMLPGLSVPGLFDLNQTYSVSRLDAPFGYWNALALFVVMGVPIGLALAIDRGRRPGVRLAASVVVQLMILVIFFTYSRGGLLALAVALMVAVLAGGVRLRALLWLALIALVTIPPLLYGLLSHPLSASLIPLAARERAGAVLLGIALVSALGQVALGRRLISIEERVRVAPARARAIARGLLALAGAVVVLALIASSLSAGGLSGTVSHLWHSVTATRTASSNDPARLLSADSANRLVWWKEALGAFSARPIGGWGAGSFPVVHLLYRKNTLSVREPHSAPLQWLAETGLIGAALGIGCFVVLLWCAVRVVRRGLPGQSRLLAAALLAAAIAYAVHACYDLDADIPGLTIPMLLMLGVLLGSAVPSPDLSLAARGAGPAGMGLAGRPGVAGGGAVGGRILLSGRREGEPAIRAAGLGARALAIVAVTITACSLALSAALPAIASQEASSALVTAAGGGGASLARAQRLARSAERLDPLSDSGLLAAAEIAERRGRLALARDYLLEAVRRDPSDLNAWSSLPELEIQTGDYAQALAAAQRVVDLDPLGVADGELVRASLEASTAIVGIAPPGDSPTRGPTPAPAASASAPAGSVSAPSGSVSAPTGSVYAPTGG